MRYTWRIHCPDLLKVVEETQKSVASTGRDTLFDGSHLALRQDVVVVTINYRLGPLGFLYLEDDPGAEYAESGNLGILDQVAALGWVRVPVNVDFVSSPAVPSGRLTDWEIDETKRAA